MIQNSVLGNSPMAKLAVYIPVVLGLPTLEAGENNLKLSVHDENKCSGPKSIIEDLPQGWDDQRWNKPNENLIHIICQGKCFFNNQKGFNP
ncbi:hypothetical protein PGT21_020956 [Puccinia graminis f. sp. tritici]|uniref:Uncharacterized protein n=1 Tax=Puccinia graminis f. sp. tritici TaxID=56615 RepID=A0A5B0R1Q4_PUCGR|nr:hypothetical protein PGT21_020956 [Puccinia graminis f. sp. tritici]